MWRRIGLLLLGCAALSLSLFSQYDWWYYGKNKVMRQTFHWRVVQTEHFSIHHYLEGQDELIRRIADTAEASYRDLSEYLNIKVAKPIPLIYYASHIDFEQTNIAGFLPPGVLAFAEPLNYRMVVQGDTAFSELSHTIRHELGHIFEYEILGPGILKTRPPLWLMEGFSDFITFHWDPVSLMTMRDLVLNGEIPQLDEGGDAPALNAGRSPYDFGHLIYEYIAETYGRSGIKKLIRAGSTNAFFRATRNPLRTFDIKPREFNHRFGQWLRKRFAAFTERDNPEDYAAFIGPDFPYAYSFTHQLSPSGEMVAVLTVNARRQAIELVLLSMRDGTVLKRVTPGYTHRYDDLSLRFNPADGPSFSWSSDSRQVAFFARKELDNYLVVLDVLSGRILHQILLRDLHDPASPVFHPQTGEIWFTALGHGQSRIYSLLPSNGTVQVRSDGERYIRSLAISPDGKRLAYSARPGRGSAYQKIYLAPSDHPDQPLPLTGGETQDLCPRFSRDGQRIYLSSDRDGAFDIYRIDLGQRVCQRLSRVRTGSFFAEEIPGTEDLLVSTYWKGRFQLFRMKPVPGPQEPLPELTEQLLGHDTGLQKTLQGDQALAESPYRPFSRLYINSVSPVMVGVGTDGGFFGYSYLALGDLMGDHSFALSLASVYGYQSYHLQYLNQRSRVQPYLHLFLTKDVYYYGLDLSGRPISWKTLRSNYGAEAGIHWPLSRATRLEATLSWYHQKENSDELMGVDIPYGQYFTGPAMPLNLSLICETTQFRAYGPNRGHTFRLTYRQFLKPGSRYQETWALEGDVRKYLHIDNHTLLALRIKGFTSGGENRLIFWTGGNNTLRGAGYADLIGDRGFFFNAELRFNLVHLMLTSIGLVGPVRGVFFFDVGGVWFQDEGFRFFRKGEGLRLQDAVSAYGFGVEWFLLGFPWHVEWVTRTDWRSRSYGGVNFWIGFDF